MNEVKSGDASEGKSAVEVVTRKVHHFGKYSRFDTVRAKTDHCQREGQEIIARGQRRRTASVSRHELTDISTITTTNSARWTNKVLDLDRLCVEHPVLSSINKPPQASFLGRCSDTIHLLVLDGSVDISVSDFPSRVGIW